ncbi:enamine deaminase RidA (YjgF/YER057c/UK114 family) [Paraburkholderia sp. Clong3]
MARIVRLNVFIASTPAFSAQSTVANGASDVIVQIFGDAGRHARAARWVLRRCRQGSPSKSKRLSP